MQLLVYQFWSEIELADVIFKYTEDILSVIFTSLIFLHEIWVFFI